MRQALLIQGETRTQIDWPRQKPEWAGGGGILWIDLQAPSREEMESLAAEFGLHEAVVRACLNPEHRARLREYRSHLLLTIDAVGRGPSEGGVTSDLGRWRMLEVNAIVGERFIITVHPETIVAIATVYQRYVKEGEGKSSLAHILYNLLETITLGHSLLLDHVDKRLDKAEDEIFAGRATSKVVDQLFTLKKHILYLRRVLGRQRDAIGALMRHEFSFFGSEARSYFLDVYEHNIRLFDLIDTYRDLISSSLDAYLSTVSNRMNDIMKTLTIVSTIMLPLTLLTGIFGMNFEVMPFLKTPGGFWVTMVSMGVVAFGMLIYFRKRGWI